jgi:hypothetical protein
MISWFAVPNFQGPPSLVSSSAERSRMTFDRLQHWTRLASGAVLLLLLQCVFMPSRAEAACSHLVTSVADRGIDVHGLDSLITGLASSLPGDSSIPAHPGPNPASPCAGGHCSSRDSLPVPAPSMPDRDRSEQWGNLSRLTPMPSLSEYALHFQEPTLRPTSLASAIFHPPRV